MDQRITIQRHTETADGIGGLLWAWADLTTNARPWANVKAVRGAESMSEGRMNAASLMLFRIYNRTDITEKDRIVWNSETWNIRNIRREGGQRLFLVIEAERGVAS